MFQAASQPLAGMADDARDVEGLLNREIHGAHEAIQDQGLVTSRRTYAACGLITMSLGLFALILGRGRGGAPQLHAENIFQAIEAAEVLDVPFKAIQPCPADLLECPGVWRHGDTGGFYCEKIKGCRDNHAGPFPNCEGQCSIGKVSKVTPAPTPPPHHDTKPAPGGDDDTGENDKGEPSDDGDDGSIAPCEHVGHECPGEWTKYGTIGGYHCLHHGGCRPWKVGPFPKESCHSQCTIGVIPTTSTTTLTTLTDTTRTQTSSTLTQTTTTTTYRGEDIKVFCFSLARVGAEMDTIRFQLSKYAGIFACDDQLVVSWSVMKVGNMGKREIFTVKVGSAPIVRSKDGTAGNSLQFMKVWDLIRDDKKKRYLKADWTVKVDPDAVLLPDRLRMHLNDHRGAKAYIRNCDKPMMSEGNMMFGDLEVISKSALIVFFANTMVCYKEIPWQSWGEDLYLMRCLEHLGVSYIDDFRMTQDGVCKGVSCADNWAAAFHPMKSVGAWEACMNAAYASR